MGWNTELRDAIVQDIDNITGSDTLTAEQALITWSTWAAMIDIDVSLQNYQRTRDDGYADDAVDADDRVANGGLELLSAGHAWHRKVTMVDFPKLAWVKR